MAHISNLAMALAAPVPSIDVPTDPDAGAPKVDYSTNEKAASGLLSPPNSNSPELLVYGVDPQSLPQINPEHELDLRDLREDTAVPEYTRLLAAKGTPLSKGALSGLDASETITAGMLAKDHLPEILLGHGPRPVREVMGELTQNVPGFSRIPPAKARRLVVAALEHRDGGGRDGNVAFCKTGWGRWDAHYKGSSHDSGIGSLDGHLSPPRSERSNYAASHSGDSGVHMPGHRLPSGYRDQHSGGSWAASSIREEDEFDMMDMDVPENEADKMSLDDSDDDSDSFNDDTDPDDGAARPVPLRKASLPTPGVPRKNYNAISADYAKRWPSHARSRRGSAMGSRPLHSTSLPCGNKFRAASITSATPEEQVAVAALLSMGSM